jgi:hypothetical protein
MNCLKMLEAMQQAFEELMNMPEEEYLEVIKEAEKRIKADPAWASFLEGVAHSIGK